MHGMARFISSPYMPVVRCRKARAGLQINSTLLPAACLCLSSFRMSGRESQPQPSSTSSVCVRTLSARQPAGSNRSKGKFLQ
jgi:hypothetical protein